MEPYLGKNDLKLFYKYLDKATNYFEFGSGGSTYQAFLRKNIKHIYSVESDFSWHTKLKNILKDANNITFIYNEMDTKPNTWGHPGIRSTREQWVKYSDSILNVDIPIDLVLIDGRFRVACCLKAFQKIDANAYILFDDFLNRPEYHIVLEYFDIVEKSSDERMVVLRKKNVGLDTDTDTEVIRRFEVVVG